MRHALSLVLVACTWPGPSGAPDPAGSAARARVAEQCAQAILAMPARRADPGEMPGLCLEARAFDHAECAGAWRGPTEAGDPVERVLRACVEGACGRLAQPKPVACSGGLPTGAEAQRAALEELLDLLDRTRPNPNVRQLWVNLGSEP